MRSLRRIFLAATVLLAPLAACDSSEQAVHIAPKQPRADRATTLHGVAFEPFRTELTGSERQRLTAFVREFPGDRTTVNIVTSPDSPSLQSQRAAAIRGQLQSLGVPVGSVIPAQGLAIGPNTVVVSAERYSVRALNCPDWSKSTGYDPLNMPHSNLGCATARNLADMVADPRDLEMGRTPGQGSGHLGAAAVDRLYNDKVKSPPASGGSASTPGAGSGTSSSGTN